jgi:6-phosphogluconolactonase
MDFHPTLKIAYVVNEISNEVDAYTIQADGALEKIQTISTLPMDFRGNNTAAAIEVTPTGQFLFASNRGHNSIAQFTIDAGTGMLKANGHTTDSVSTARCFALDASGKYLVLAKQMSGNLVSYRIESDGTLKIVKSVHLGRTAPWVGPALLPP